MQKKGEKTMKREEWKRSYKRICCLLAGHRSRDCALRMQPGKRHTGRKTPGRGSGSRRSRCIKIVRNGGRQSGIKASRKPSWLRIQIFPMEQPQSSLRTKRRIQPIHPWAFITPWRQRPREL